MDQPDRVTRANLVGSLQGLRRVNRWLGGVRLSLRAMAPLVQKAHRSGSDPVRICDVGTGAADIPVALARWARKEKIAIHITAVELSPALAEAARKAARVYSEITVVEGDARAVLAAASEEAGPGTSRKQDACVTISRAARFDIVSANLFLHHFPAEEVKAWLALMDGACKTGIVVNDLERAFWPWFGIRTLGWVLSRNSVFLHDAPLSVRRAYTVPEWKAMAKQAGLKKARVIAHAPGRVVVTTQK